MEKPNIVIGGAWPYGNNSLHMGHLAGLISGDILARYYRANGYKVAYVSGTDCHGTPITERAKKEGKSPKDIAGHYDQEDRETFKTMGFSYDLYTNTDTEYHKQEVQNIFKQIYDNGYIYEKIEPQAYCPTCEKFLADREIQITCPECGTITKADQCDGCGHVPTVNELEDGVCLNCGSKTIQKDNKNLYFALSKFQNEIEEHTQKVNAIWRANAKNETSKYLKQGLIDRAVTRDLDWGVDIPLDGYASKKMYVWIEAVLGYITATKKWCEDTNQNWEEYWKQENNKIYMVHGKDNIVFHSIIFNALLLGTKQNYHLVDTIVSTEYLNINDEKISKSKGNGVPAIELAKIYAPDTLRYYMISNGPEKKDSNFTTEGLEAVHNGEIVNKFGNLVNRTLKFKGLEVLPEGKMDIQAAKEVANTYSIVAENIKHLEFREAIQNVMRLVEFANKYYDERQPWIQKRENMEAFNDTIYTCANIIANLSNLFEPFMPFASAKIREYLELGNPTWEVIEAKKGISLSKVEPLFNRIEKKS